MRNVFVSLCGLTCVSSLLLVGAAQAAGRRSEMEKSLLGIRVLQTYQNVLAKYGQPTRVYRLDESVRPIYAYDAEGNLTGGVRGLEVDPTAGQAGGRGGLAGGMGMPGAMAGGRGMGGFPGMPGGMMGGGMRGGISGMSGGGFPGGMPGGQGRPMGGPPGGRGLPAGMGGFPGMPGAMSGGQGPPMGGPPGGLGLPSGMGGAGRGLGANNTGQAGGRFIDSGGYMWLYFYPSKELLYWFVFNSDGRVIGIREDGKKFGQPTSRNLSLGDPVKKAYTEYGWPDSVDMLDTSIAMHYNLKHHIQINVLNNKVTSIAVCLTEDQSFFNVINGGGNLPGGGRNGLGLPGLAGGGGRGGRGRLGLPGLAGGGGGGKGGEGGAD